MSGRVFAPYLAGGPGSCTSPIDLSSVSSPFSSTTIGAADNDPSTSAPDLVFTYLLQPGYTVTFQQMSTDYDSIHILRYGGSCPGNTTVDSTGDDYYTPVSWSNTLSSAQPVYYTQTGDFGKSGEFTLTWNVSAFSAEGETGRGSDSASTCDW